VTDFKFREPIEDEYHYDSGTQMSLPNAIEWIKEQYGWYDEYSDYLWSFEAILALDWLYHLNHLVMALEAEKTRNSRPLASCGQDKCSISRNEYKIRELSSERQVLWSRP
jgi:hypothetical protein